MTNLEKLRTGTPKQIADMLCKCLKNCSACPHSFRECCNNGEKNGFEEWLNDEANTPDDATSDAKSDAPKGWIKLKVLEKVIYINVSKIVALTNSSDGAVTKVHTVGAEEDPWMVDESIDEVIEKIGKA